VRVNFPRSYVDVNREPYELDPRMFSGRLPSFANTRSMRVAGGLGTIPRVVGDGQEIYRERLSVDDALARIEALYKPYHRALRRLINKAHQAFGTVIVVDCHSMPSIGVSRDEPRRPDVVIGDRYGTSCAALLPDMVEETMSAMGYSVGRNKPYAGGFITEHYGNPASGLHTIQLELNRAIYMDERQRERSTRFAQVAADFTELAEVLATIPFARNDMTRKRKKGRLRTSGPSLGRKRPRRAAIARGATAPQQYATALHKAQVPLIHFRCKIRKHYPTVTKMPKSNFSPIHQILECD
jgi:N-formylglutamate amidohydrolase